MPRPDLLAVLLPHRCPVCGGTGAGSPCPACAADLPPPPALPPPPGLDACHAAVGYRDGGRAIVSALKFTGANGPLPWVARQLAGRIRVDGLHVVTWVPTTPAHRRHRGRDQAEAVATAVAGRLGLPRVGLLRRRPGPPQALRTGAARRVGPPLVLARPRAGGRPDLAGLGVLVVDDVVTTGGSMGAAARALRAGGAARVVGAAVARTPPGWFR
jgi:predicted amidophosphoribosyltransferase